MKSALPVIRTYTFNDGTCVSAQDLALAEAAPTVVEQVLREAGWAPRSERMRSWHGYEGWSSEVPAREQAWWPPAGLCATGHMKACWHSFGAAWMEHLRHGGNKP